MIIEITDKEIKKYMDDQELKCDIEEVKTIIDLMIHEHIKNTVIYIKENRMKKER